MGTFPVRPHGSAHARNVPSSLLRVTIPNDPSFLSPSLFYEGRRTHVRQSVVHTRRKEKERGGTVDAYHNSDGGGAELSRKCFNIHSSSNIVSLHTKPMDAD